MSLKIDMEKDDYLNFKAGDIITDGRDIAIFKDSNFVRATQEGCMFVRCIYSTHTDEIRLYEIGGLNPIFWKHATKDEEDILLKKISDSGYRWDKHIKAFVEGTKEIKVLKSQFDLLKKLQEDIRDEILPNSTSRDIVLWGVMETHSIPTANGYGDSFVIAYEEGSMTLTQALMYISERIEQFGEEIQEKWDNLNKTNIWEVCHFMRNVLNWNNIYRVYEVKNVDSLSTNSGIFLTEKACKEYITNNSYGLEHPRPYPIPLFRNSRDGIRGLIKILVNTDFDNQDEI